MLAEGPPLEHLTRRLADTPQAFLGEPRIGKHGSVDVPALVHDLLALHGLSVDPAELQALQGRNHAAERNAQQLLQIWCWLLADSSFRERFDPDALLQFLRSGAEGLAAQHPASAFVEVDERREELSRMSLRAAGLRPLGESQKVAEDRWLNVSTEERVRLLAASRAAEERARQIREALARKAAEESADKWTRE